MRKQYHFRLVDNDTHIWDVHRLVRLANSFDAEPMLLSDIKELDENWWYKNDLRAPTPRSIAAHIALVHKADPIYPIILCSEGHLMDGMHRIVKALVEKRETVLAIKFTTTPKPDFVNVAIDSLPYEDEEIDP